MDTGPSEGAHLVERIDDYFLPENLTPFTDDDLAAGFSEASFINRAFPVAINELTRLANLPDLKPLIADIEANLRKFSFGKVSLEEWDRRYSFPRSGAVRAFQRKSRNKYNRRVFAEIINENSNKVAEWIDNEIIPAIKSKSEKVNMLIGGTGAGKSTFNKYITSKYFEKFKSERIITSRVEYQKLFKFVSRINPPKPNASKLDQSSVQSTIQRYVYCCILRDIFHYNWSTTASAAPGKSHQTFFSKSQAEWPEIDISLPDSQRLFLEFLSDHIGQELDSKKVVRAVQTAIEAFKEPDLRRRVIWFHELVENDTMQVLLEPFASYAAKRGISMYVIMDGLDYVQVSDFIGFTTHREIINLISDWLITSGRRLPLPNVGSNLYPVFQVTMREDTYELFCKDFSYALADPQVSIYYVLEPSFVDVFRSIGASPLWHDPGGRTHVSVEELLENFQNIQASLLRALRLGGRDMPRLFLHNMRFRIYFARDVIEELISSTMDALDGGRIPRTQENLLTQLRTEVSLLASSKRYRLVDILLHSKNERFANFVRIESGGIDLSKYEADPSYPEQVIRDNNIRSGYIGNIFNYHIPYRDISDITYFLEKLRILDILVAANGEPVNIKALAERFSIYGWKLSPYYKVSIAILIRENLITANSAQAGADGYVPTELGRIMRQNLVCNMTYLENVYFGCYFPSVIKRLSADIYRGNSPRLEWSTSSILHCWILLKLIRTAEVGAIKTFFEEIRSAISNTVRDMVYKSEVGPQIATRALRRIREFETRLIDE